MDKIQGSNFESKLARIDERTEYLVEEIKEINRKIDSCYVTQKEFEPVKKIVYSLVGIIITIVVTSLTYVVIVKGG
jgi:hypothetical protein